MKASTAREASGIAPMHLYRLLYGRYGNLEWWPADSDFEVMVGAVLTQRTAWRNVEMALANLRTEGVNDPPSLLALDRDRLEELIRPSGTYRQKASRLQALFSMILARTKGSLEAFLDRPVTELRRDLLDVKGIGPETADSIILYAARGCVFVVDAYTRRILDRLGIGAGPSYDEVAEWFVMGLPEDADLYGNFHAILVELAKDHCRTRPVCDGCPLGGICPSSTEKVPPSNNTGPRRYQV